MLDEMRTRSLTRCARSFFPSRLRRCLTLVQSGHALDDSICCVIWRSVSDLGVTEARTYNPSSSACAKPPRRSSGCGRRTRRRLRSEAAGLIFRLSERLNLRSSDWDPRSHKLGELRVALLQFRQMQLSIRIIRDQEDAPWDRERPESHVDVQLPWWHACRLHCCWAT